jgi:hypothetical protein
VFCLIAFCASLVHTTSLMHTTSLVYIGIPRAPALDEPVVSAPLDCCIHQTLVIGGGEPSSSWFLALPALVLLRVCFPVSLATQPHPHPRRTRTRTRTRARTRPTPARDRTRTRTRRIRHQATMPVARSTRCLPSFLSFRARVCASEPVCGDRYAPAGTGSSPYRHTQHRAAQDKGPRPRCLVFMPHVNHAYISP